MPFQIISFACLVSLACGREACVPGSTDCLYPTAEEVQGAANLLQVGYAFKEAVTETVQGENLARARGVHIGSMGGGATAVDTICSNENGQHDAAVVLLVPGPPGEGVDWEKTKKSLKSLKLIEDEDRLEVRIFHDEADNFSTDHLLELFEAAKPRKVCAVKVRFAKFPRGITEDSPSPWSKRSRWGYEHMIRFFFVDLLDESTGFLNGLTYWMRMDSDSSLADPVPDPFQEFDKDPALGYIHNIDSHDCGIVAKGLNEFARSFALNHTIDPSSIPAVQVPTNCVKGFYNNLELGRISAFQTPGAKEWTQAVVDNKGIYTHRWGDALLRRLLIELTNMKTSAISPQMMKSYRHQAQSPDLKWPG